MIAADLEHEPAPIELEPRPCQFCGLTIDRHRRDDTPEGPEFFCINFEPDEMTLVELERRAELRAEEEVAAIRARLDAMDDPAARQPPRAQAEPYRPAQSTIDAFHYIVSLKQPDRLVAWLQAHERDRPHLLKLLES